MTLKEFGKKIETGGKNFLRKSMLSIIPDAKRPPAFANARSARRILAVRHDARLGNLLLLTPSLRLMRQACPNAEIDVLISGRYGDALAFNPFVGHVLTQADLPGIALGRRYDIAFDFSPHHAFSLSSAFWTALSRAPRRVGFKRGDAGKFINDLVLPPQKRRHETLNLALLVSHAAPEICPLGKEFLRPEWFFGPGERETGRSIWSGLGLDDSSIALFLGARAEKKIAADWFIALARKIADSGRKAALLTGPAERESLKAAAIPRSVILVPDLALRPFAAALSNAKALVSADTGPMHLAAALGVPTLGLFSHTEPWRFGYGELERNSVLETPGRHPEVEEAWAALKVL
ncbi:MAG: glycosyltransferase family 9 protein [Elusimicrobiota bacterium]